MKTTGIRLEVEPWLYDVLVEEQEQRRLNIDRKQSLSSLILEFCLKGLTVSGHFVQNTSHSVQENSDSMQNFEGFVQKNQAQNALISPINLDEIAKLKEIMLRKGQDLQEKARELSTREQKIRSKENELAEKAQKTLQQWNEFLINKEQSQQKSLDTANKRLLTDQHNLKLEEKKEIIMSLKAENVQLKNSIIKSLQKIEQQIEKNIILDYIIPFLPSVISLIGFFMTNKKIESIQELNPIQTEIGNIMKKLSDTDKKKLSTKLEESLKLFSDKPVLGK